MAKILKKSQGSISNITCFVGQKLILQIYYIQNVKDGIEIRVCTISKESLNHFSQFISVKVKKILRKSQAQFRRKFRKLRLRQNGGFLTKKVCRTFSDKK